VTVAPGRMACELSVTPPTMSAVMVLLCPAAGAAQIKAIQADSKQTPARESRCRGMAKPPSRRDENLVHVL
jgi:hypothetical protein